MQDRTAAEDRDLALVSTALLLLKLVSPSQQAEVVLSVHVVPTTQQRRSHARQAVHRFNTAHMCELHPLEATKDCQLARTSTDALRMRGQK